jgi:hypothetical protein
MLFDLAYPTAQRNQPARAPHNEDVCGLTYKLKVVRPFFVVSTQDFSQGKGEPPSFSVLLNQSLGNEAEYGMYSFLYKAPNQ